MTDRELLIDLMRKGYETVPIGGFVYGGIADYLLANGVIVTPCKVGDTVYVISFNEIISCTVVTINYNSWRIPTSLYLKYSEVNGFAFIQMQVTDRTVFLTREEAEKALKNRRIKQHENLHSRENHRQRELPARVCESAG